MIDEVFSRVFDVFNTSGNPPEAGKKWRDEIRDSLDKAQVVLVILTPRSILRDWVLFESGAAWLAAEKHQKKLIPCLYNLDQFPSSLSEYQGINLSQRESIHELIDTLKTVSNLTPSESMVNGEIDKYLSKLANTDLSEPDKTEKAAPSSDAQKLSTIILNFFSNNSQAMQFAKTLKKHNIFDENAYETFLKMLLDKKF